MKPTAEMIMDELAHAYIMRGLIDPDEDYPDEWYNEMTEYAKKADFPDIGSARMATWDMAYNDWRRME